jgi:selenium metabolism protein YedF
MRIIDCRRMACPMPVVTVKRSLEDSFDGELRVLVDDGPARENVTRFALNRGYMVEEQREGEGYALLLTGMPAVTPVARDATGGGRVIVISSDRMGDGPEELGRLLMKNFIITLLELEEMPERIFFLNSGVLLTTEGSEVIEALERLACSGVEILSCGVCLDYFHTREKLRSGSVTNMFTMAEALLHAASVIRI